MREVCEEVFAPREIIRMPGKKPRSRSLIPRVLFIKVAPSRAIELENESRKITDVMPAPFWIYRYPRDNSIQVIPQESINLLKMLTAEDTTKCEIFKKTDFRPKERVRVTDGIYKGYTGYVQRVKKNLHVVVKIEGVCMVLLPFIHPDMLEKIPLDSEK